MECDYCHCKWDSEIHIPKILPCSHTVCRACLYSLLDKSISLSSLVEPSLLKCPLCQNELKNLTSKNAIDNLSKNNNLLEISNKIDLLRSRSNYPNLNKSNMNFKININEINDNNNELKKDFHSSFSNSKSIMNPKFLDVSNINNIDNNNDNNNNININDSKILNINSTNTSKDSSQIIKSKTFPFKSEIFELGIKNCYYPLCEKHKNKSNFYYFSEEEKPKGEGEEPPAPCLKKIFVCNECIKNDRFDNLIPVPNLNVQNESKLYACKNKSKLLLKEINKIESFLNNFQKNFEKENRTKINELFEYINTLVDYSKTMALTIFSQCNNEQKNHIESKLTELKTLKEELDSFNKKIEEYLNKIRNKENINVPESEEQLEIDQIYTRLGNYINYENELNLFQMEININEDVKENLFNLIQNFCNFNVELLKMKNDKIPTIKDLLKKNETWPCICGKTDNKKGEIFCEDCKRYRKLETYNNILFNPLNVDKKETEEFYKRRKHEAKLFKILIEKSNEKQQSQKINKSKNSNMNINSNIDSSIKNGLFAIDALWFNRWKTYATNDLEESLLSNDVKNISENKLIGVLPPGEIDNSEICEVINDNSNSKKKIKDSKISSNSKSSFNRSGKIKYKVKSGLDNKKDYFVINQYLWEWFLLNYGGGPEICIDYVNKLSSTSSSRISDISSKSYNTLNNINNNNISKNSNDSQDGQKQNHKFSLASNIAEKNEVDENDEINYKEGKCDTINSSISSNVINESSIHIDINKSNINKNIESNGEGDDNNDEDVELNIHSELGKKILENDFNVDESIDSINNINDYTFDTKLDDFKSIHKKGKNINNEKDIENKENKEDKKESEDKKGEEGNFTSISLIQLLSDKIKELKK